MVTIVISTFILTTFYNNILLLTYKIKIFHFHLTLVHSESFDKIASFLPFQILFQVNLILLMVYDV